MSFELLPNEILIESFEYLNSFDIFNSFDGLNYRLNELIRNIPLYLNFQDIQKSNFDKFCMKILINAKMKKQIYLLKLSNKNACGQIQTFLETSSFEEFSHLQSLTLIGVRQNNMQKLKSMLPFIDKLSYFQLLDSKIEVKEILSAISVSNIKKISSLTNLTLSKCNLEELYQILSNIPMLKYLNVQNISKPYHLTYNSNYRAIHLKKLIMIRFMAEFQDFEIFIKQIPNLKYLTISTHNDINMIDAFQWEFLIQSSLYYLKYFQFEFSYYDYNKDIGILNRFKQFQNDFWQKQHHWYTEYEIRGCFSLIYTIPYVSNTYELTPNLIRYPNKLLNISNIFDNVTNLTIYHEAIIKKYQHQFSYVKSLILKHTSINRNEIDNILLRQEYLSSLKMIINLSNVKHLNISSNFNLESSTLLLQILKETLYLSSITVDPRSLISLFKNDELCKYLNKIIKKMDIFGSSRDLFGNTDNLEQFCKIFSNIEQLKCSIDRRINFLFILNHLLQLSSIEICVLSYDDSENFISWFQEDMKRLNANFHIEELITDKNTYDDVCVKDFSIWISRSII